MNKINTEKKENIFYIISVFFILTVDSSFYFVNSTSGTTRILINLMAAFFLFLSSKRKFIFKTDFIFILLVVIIIPLISGIIIQNAKQTTIICIAILIGGLVSQTIGLDEFEKYYNRIILFLSVYSLVILIIYILFPNLIRLLPIIEKDTPFNNFNCIFAIVADDPYVLRNYGYFWEPGAFSVFLSIALYIELYKQKTRIIYLIIYSITILTTLSTLGITCMILLYMTYIVANNRIANKKIRSLLLIFLGCFAIYLLIDGERIIFHILGKLIYRTNNKLNSSTAVRLNAIIYPVQAFLKSPFVGIGYNNFLRLQDDKCSGMATFTHINWFCIYGVFGGLSLIIGCIRFFCIKKANILVNFALFIFSILLFSTENFVQITLTYILVFYGLLKE